MRILLVASAYNSMTQRVHAELADRGHEVSVELALGDEVIRDGVRRWDPDLVIAPMLTTAIPADIWSSRPCFIVHPGPPGDRGPSSLDWAIMGGETRWGVTVLQANAEMDAGDIWASAGFAVPADGAKSSVYRTEVADAAVEAVLAAVTRFAGGSYRPQPLDYGRNDVTGRCRPPCRQPDRQIDWAAEPTSAVLAKLRAADFGPRRPGRDRRRRVPPGRRAPRRRPARTARDDPGPARRRDLPGDRGRRGLDPAGAPPPDARRAEDIQAAGHAGAPRPLAGVPEAPLVTPPGRRSYRQISYRESGGVGYLEFCFPGGAMSTGQCRRLLAAWRHAQARPVKVIVLGGPRDFFGNGIHLNVIQAADDPAEESWRNINAMNDLVHAILTTTAKLTIAALAGNAAAGGLMLALAADQVWCRDGAVLNPHYRLMGLHGSEYWTYTLPRRVGVDEAAQLTQACLPVSPAFALRSGLVNRVITGDPASYRAQVTALARQLAASSDYRRG